MNAELSARTTAATAVLGDYRAALASASLTSPPGPEWMLRLASVLGDLLDELGDVGPAAAPAASGPFDEGQAVTVDYLGKAKKALAAAERCVEAEQHDRAAAFAALASAYVAIASKESSQ